MITNDQKLNEIINYFGDKHQTVKAIEEMAELSKELCKAHDEVANCPSNIDAIIEEMADVELMMEELRRIFEIDPKEIETRFNYKVERTYNRYIK